MQRRPALRDPLGRTGGKAHQDFLEPAVAGLFLEHLLQEVGQPVPRVGIFQGVLEHPNDLVESFLEEDVDELNLVREASVHGAHTHSGVLGDVVERHAQPPLSEEIPGGVPDPTTDIEETLSVMTDLVRAGKVRLIGSSTTPPSSIVEAQWIAERTGLQRFRTEQPPYSILNRGVEREVLPVAQRYGIGTLIWGPLAQGLLTGRVRTGQENTLRRAQLFRHLNDQRRIDVVEQLMALAEAAGLPMTHLAIAFTIAHPGVTSALLGPRTMDHLDDLLGGATAVLPDEILDKIYQIAPPGTDVGTLDQDYTPPALQNPHLRRRPLSDRSAQ
jgi:diketogulonate reductase-like aldo/keto reductase